MPVSYFLLKKWDKREWSWVVIPVISILSSAILFGIGAEDRLGDIETNAVSIVSLEDDGSGTGYGGVSFLSQTAGDYSVSLNKEYHPFPVSMKGNGRYSTNIPVVDPSTEKTNVHFKNVEFWSPRSLSVQLPQKKYGFLRADLTYQDGKIIGTIKNQMQYEISKMYILSGDERFEIDGIKEGETKDISIKAGSFNMFEPLTRRSFFNQLQMVNRSRQETEDMQKIRLMEIAMQSQLFSNNSPRLVAFTKESLFTVKVENDKTDQSNLSMFIQPMTIHLPDGKGLSLDIDVTTPELVSVTGRIEHNGLLFGENMIHVEAGIYELRYNFPDGLEGLNFELNELSFDLSHRSARKFNGDSSFSIYNVKTKQFEKIENFTTFKNQPHEKYVSNGEIRMRVKATNEGSIEVPDVLMKGVTNP